jgi:hypothetical protein
MTTTPQHPAAADFPADAEDDVPTGRSDAEHGDQFPGDDADENGDQ